MFKPIVVSESQFRNVTEQPVIAESDVKRVFMVLHGFYGNLFLSKFSTGAVENGEDQGIANARRIWAHGLSVFDAETIKSALRACQERHSEYPPSLPQFVALCAAKAPRRAFQQANAIGMSDGLRSQYARQARAIIAKHEEKARKRDAGFVPSAPGLDGLKQALANAIGTAGGDEGAALLRLDRMFPRVAA
jgi:hypothetical protein